MIVYDFLQDLWKTRKPPVPLKLEELRPAAAASASTNGHKATGSQQVNHLLLVIRLSRPRCDRTQSWACKAA